MSNKNCSLGTVRTRKVICVDTLSVRNPSKTKCWKKCLNKKSPKNTDSPNERWNKILRTAEAKLFFLHCFWGFSSPRKLRLKYKHRWWIRWSLVSNTPRLGGGLSYWCAGPVFNNQDDQSFGYIKILEGLKLFYSTEEMWRFQQDREPKGTSKSSSLVPDQQH